MKTLKRMVVVACLMTLTALMAPASMSAFAATPKAPAKKAHAAPSRAGKISINKATVDQLATLPRIGPRTAQRIVDYRKAHKGFKTLDELQNVKGIGVKTMERLRPHITL